MKKLLLLSVLFLGSLSASAQYDCTDPIVLTTNGTITAPDVSGTFYDGVCYTHATTSADNVNNPSGPMYGLWYSFTPTASGEVTLNSNLPQNSAPFSDDTKVSILTGDCDALVCYDASDDVSTTNYRTTITFPVAAGVTYFIQWDNYWNDAGFDFDFTFTEIPCLPVYTINAATNITTTSLTLNWDASLSAPTGYEVEYGAPGFVQGTGTTVTTATNSVALSSLTASTVYDFYVRANCGTTQSAWTAVNAFTTAKVCPHTSGLDTAAQVVGWTIATNGPGAQGLNSTGTAGQASTPGYWIFASSTTTPNNNWLFSPAFSLQANETVTISFYHRASTSARSLRVTAGTANSAAAQTTVLGTIAIPAGATWTQVTVPTNFVAPSAGIYYFGFNDNSNATATAVNMRLDTFNFTSVLGTSDFLASKFSVYPNPSSEVINFSNDANAVVTNVELADLNGRVVKTQAMNATEGQVSVSDLAAGVYMMKITTDQGIATKKLIKN